MQKDAYNKLQGIDWEYKESYTTFKHESDTNLGDSLQNGLIQNNGISALSKEQMALFKEEIATLIEKNKGENHLGSSLPILSDI